MQKNPNPIVVAIDPDLRSLQKVRQALESDYQVYIFPEFPAARRAMQRGLAAAVIVAGFGSSEESGVELLRELRDFAPTRDIPIVALSAAPLHRSFRTLMSCGADDCLNKPIIAEELQQAVQARLRRICELKSTVTVHGALTIRSLGRFQLSLGSESLSLSEQDGELLLFLLEHGEAELDLVKRLFSDGAKNSDLSRIFFRLRCALANHAAIRFRPGYVSIEVKRSFVWDVQVFEASAKDALDSGNYQTLQQVLMTYPGPFLPQAESAWTNRRRDRIEKLYLDLLSACIKRAPRMPELASNESPAPFMSGRRM